MHLNAEMPKIIMLQNLKLFDIVKFATLHKIITFYFECLKTVLEIGHELVYHIQTHDLFL